MDASSIRGRITALTGTCSTIASSLEHIGSKYQPATLTIAALCSESTLVSAALARVPALLENGRISSRLDLLQTLDTSLTACRIIFGGLQKELQKLAPESSPSSSGLAIFSWGTKGREPWKEDMMKDYLSLLRAQQSTLSLLVQLLQPHSSKEPPVGSAEPVRFGQSNVSKSGSGQATQFAFDNVLEKSKAYQKTIEPVNTATAQNTMSEKAGTDGSDIHTHDRNSRAHPGTAGDTHWEALESLTLDSGATDFETETLVGKEASPEGFSAAGSPHGYTRLSTASTQTQQPWGPSRTVAPLEFSPNPIAFARPFTRSVKLHVQFRNTNPGPLVFAVKVTDPRGYCVRPNWGYIGAHETLVIEFEKMPMDAQPAATLRLSHDKFLFRSFAVPNMYQCGEHADVSAKIRELAATDAKLVQDVKVRVEFLPDGAQVPQYSLI